MQIEILPTLTPAMLKTLTRAIDALPEHRPRPNGVSLPSYNRGWDDGYKAVKEQLGYMIKAAQWAEIAYRVNHEHQDEERGPGPAHPAARAIAARPDEE